MPEKMSRRDREGSRSRSLSRRSMSHSPARRRSESYSKRKESSRHRSRTRSHSRTPVKYRSRYSRSRSRSNSSYYRRRRSHSRGSYYAAKKRHDNPQQCRCIGVFGLSVFTDERKIRDIFSKFGTIDRVQVVIDAKTRKSRGFCFVYFENMADAKVAKEQCSGMEVDGRRIRVDYSITQRPHTPTPGVYMGKPTRSYRDDYEKHRNGRSPSPHHRSSRRHRSRSRSRSRSYSSRRDRRYRY